ncbi:MAG: tetratricopeptide repeat protein [Hyphomicrobiales bacterium]
MRNFRLFLLPLFTLMFAVPHAIAQSDEKANVEAENEKPATVKSNPSTPNPALAEKAKEDTERRPSPGEVEQKILDRARASLGELEPDADVAYGYFQRGLYLSALAVATDLAEIGDGAAQALIGELYRQGLGVVKDQKIAFSWFKLGADNNNREAAFQLGFMHLDGIGTERNKQEAAKYFTIAAEQNHVLGLYNIGLMRLTGEVLEKDIELAADSLLKAAKLGNHDAQFAIGELYREGHGVKKDQILATIYFGQAARGGHDTAQIEYATRLLNGIGIGKNEDDAARWFLVNARAGNAIAQNRLAHLYRTGAGVPLDPLSSARWHLISKKQGFKDKHLDVLFNELDDEAKAAATKLAEKWVPTAR